MRPLYWSVMYTIWSLFFTSILLFLSDLPPAASLGFITGATDNHSPETLLAVSNTFPAGVIVGNAPSFIEKKSQFLFSFLAHSRHRHSSFLPSWQCPVQDSEIWSRFGIIFAFFALYTRLFWPQIYLPGVSPVWQSKMQFGRVSVSFWNNSSGLLYLRR